MAKKKKKKSFWSSLWSDIKKGLGIAKSKTRNTKKTRTYSKPSKKTEAKRKSAAKSVKKAVTSEISKGHRKAKSKTSGGKSRTYTKASKKEETKRKKAAQDLVKTDISKRRRRQEALREQQGGFSTGEINALMNVSRMPLLGQQIYNERADKGLIEGIGDNWTQRQARSYEDFAKSNPFYYNLLRYSSPVDTELIAENATGRNIDTTDETDNAAGTVGQIAGYGLGYFMQGGTAGPGASQGLRGLLNFGTGRLGRAASRAVSEIGGDALAGSVQNALQSASEVASIQKDRAANKSHLQENIDKRYRELERNKNNLSDWEYNQQKSQIDKAQAALDSQDDIDVVLEQWAETFGKNLALDVAIGGGISVASEAVTAAKKALARKVIRGELSTTQAKKAVNNLSKITDDDIANYNTERLNYTTVDDTNLSKTKRSAGKKVVESAQRDIADARATSTQIEQAQGNRTLSRAVAKGTMDGDTIVNARGRVVATIDGEELKNANGTTIGTIDGNTIKNSRGETVGTIRDGEVKNSKGETIGEVEEVVDVVEGGTLSKATVKDGNLVANGETVAKIDGNKIVDSDGDTVGTIKNGTVRDVDGEIVGKVDSDGNITQATSRQRAKTSSAKSTTTKTAAMSKSTKTTSKSDTGTVNNNVVTLSNGTSIGTIKSGTITDSYGNKLGTIKNGEVKDISGKVIGKADGNKITGVSKLHADPPASQRVQPISKSVDVSNPTKAQETVDANYTKTRAKDLPKYDSNGNKITETAEGLVARGDLAEEVTEEITSRALRGDLGIKQKSMDEMMSRANKVVEADVNAAADQIEAAVKVGKPLDDEQIALLSSILNRAVKDGDVELQRRMANAALEVGTREGRGLNAMKLLRRATPEGRVIGIHKDIERLNKLYENRLKGEKIEVSQESIDDLKNAKTADEIEEAQEKLRHEIWKQIPADFWEKSTAWRYTAMLANPKTHIRNILGNAIFTGVRSVSNPLRGGIEELLQRRGLIEQSERTATVYNRLSETSKKNRSIARKFLNDNKEFLGNDSKYIDNPNMRPRDMDVFKNEGIFGKAMNMANKGNAKLLEWEDTVTSKSEFIATVDRIAQARKIDLAKIDAKKKREIMDIARDEAREASYRNDCRLATFINELKRTHPNDTIGRKLAGQAVDAIIPFVRTPINLFRQSVNYSPVALTRATYTAIRHVARSDKPTDWIKFARDLSTGLTGTGVMALGYMAYKHGLMTAEIEGGEKYQDWQKTLGEQAYSVKFTTPFGEFRLPISWAVPVSIPLMAGSRLGQIIEAGEMKEDEAVDVLLQMFDPFVEQSFLQGISNILTVAQGKGATEQLFYAAGISPFTSYVGQFFPTIGNQLAHIIDPTWRNTQSDKVGLVGELETSAKRLMNKVPGMTFALPAQLDMWGNERSTSHLMAFFNNLVSPGTVSKHRLTEVDEEITRLYQALPADTRDDVIPSLEDSNTLEADKKYHLSMAELTAYNKKQGQTAYQDISRMLDSGVYPNISNAKQAKAIKKMYTLSQNVAKYDTLVKKNKPPKEALKLAFNENTGAFTVNKAIANAVGRYVNKGHKYTDYIDMQRKLLSDAGGNSKLSKNLTFRAMEMIEYGASKDLRNLYNEISGEEGEDAYTLNDKIRAVQRYYRTGGNKQELTPVLYNMVDLGNKNRLEEARAIFLAGDVQRVYNLFDTTATGTLRNHYSNIYRGLYNQQIGLNQIERMKDSVDSNNNGHLTTEEAMRAAEKYGKNRNQKAIIFAAVANWNANNPYGSINTTAKGNGAKGMKAVVAKGLGTSKSSKSSGSEAKPIPQKNGYYIHGNGKKVSYKTKTFPGTLEYTSTHGKAISRIRDTKKGTYIYYTDGSIWFNPKKQVKTSTKSKTYTRSSGGSSGGGSGGSGRRSSGGGSSTFVPPTSSYRPTANSVKSRASIVAKLIAAGKLDVAPEDVYTEQVPYLTVAKAGEVYDNK